jgi:AraC-like DNA-binding protein
VPAAERPRGIVSRWADEARLHSERHPPSDDLAPFVDLYWTARWDYRGCEPHVFENLTQPSVQLVLERGASSVLGIVSGKFRRELAGTGEVLGIAFHPGQFAPFAGTPISRLTDRRVPMREVFDVDVDALEQSAFAPTDVVQRISIVEAFLRGRRPCRDARADLAFTLVERIRGDRDIAKVDDLLAHAGLGKRALQRLFNDYVGQGPKWVIQRIRLQEATEQLAEQTAIDHAALASELGYADQAHFIRDFRDGVGMTPDRFRRRGR